MNVKNTTSNTIKYSLNWKGKRLITLISDEITYNYSSDVEGRRIRKSSSEDTVLYTYNGNQLISEKNTNYYIRYHYGVDGKVMLFVYLS